MHSSKIRTVHCSGYLGPGVLPGGVCRGGCLPRGCLPRGCLPGGVFLPRGCLPRMLVDTPLPMDRILDACETATTVADGKYGELNIIVGSKFDVNIIISAKFRNSCARSYKCKIVTVN